LTVSGWKWKEIQNFNEAKKLINDLNFEEFIVAYRLRELLWLDKTVLRQKELEERNRERKSIETRLEVQWRREQKVRLHC
jgi:hypothetical protein